MTAQIDKEIKRLISEAIAKSRATTRSNTFALTPEAIELEKNFVLNKGKLSWPVTRGVIIQRFGTQAHPVVKTAKIKSNGIIIATPEGQSVRTVFDGEILSVLKFKGSNPTILVRHGNYITAYKNLSKVFVKKAKRFFQIKILVKFLQINHQVNHQFSSVFSIKQRLLTLSCGY